MLATICNTALDAFLIKTSEEVRLRNHIKSDEWKIQAKDIIVYACRSTLVSSLVARSANCPKIVLLYQYHQLSLIYFFVSDSYTIFCKFSNEKSIIEINPSLWEHADKDKPSNRRIPPRSWYKFWPTNVNNCKWHARKLMLIHYTFCIIYIPLCSGSLFFPDLSYCAAPI